MYRSSWELATYIRHHTTDLAAELRACVPLGDGTHGLAHRLARLRFDLGIGLIQAGLSLAGDNMERGIAPPPTRPATWRTGP